MQRPGLSHSQRVAWLRLARSERIGSVTFHNFINRFGSADAALEALPGIMARSRGGDKTLRVCSAAEAEREIEEASRLGIRHVAAGEPDYPALLRNIDDNPPFLLIQGEISAPGRNTIPSVAVVGSRYPSVAGLKMATTLAHDLGASGHLVVSGFARGIDTAAHKAALKSGTVAVLAGGHARLFPPENTPLAREILDHGGAIVSEMPPHFEPRGQDFPRRNRIISGMSLGVVVVEAARRSGSLITARLAGEQGRQVFAVPGSPLDPRAEGTNGLIREGATLIRSADDIVQDLRPTIVDEPDTNQARFRLETVSDDDFQPQPLTQGAIDVVLSGLSSSPVHQDDLVRFTGLSPAAILSSLCELEVSGRIERHSGQWFTLLA